jgi:predicted amidohydrolase YtcJ
LFLDTRTGSLEVGKDADIAVWDQNPYDMPSPELRNLHCELTLLGGEIVFDAHNRDAHNDKGAPHGQH